MLKKTVHQYIRREGSRKILNGCYANILRPNTEENRNIPENHNLGYFWLYTTNFENWLHAWRMDISERDPNGNDLFMFAREYKEKFVGKVKEEIKKFKSVKNNFGLLAKFSIERDGATQHMKHYFGGGKENPTYIFSRNNEDKVGEKLDKFIDGAKGEIENWPERESGWVIDRIEIADVNVAR